MPSGRTTATPNLVADNDRISLNVTSEVSPPPPCGPDIPHTPPSPTPTPPPPSLAAACVCVREGREKVRGEGCGGGGWRERGVKEKERGKGCGEKVQERR